LKKQLSALSSQQYAVLNEAFRSGQLDFVQFVDDVFAEAEARASAGTAPQEPNRTPGEQNSGAGLTKK
jgi:hypothetical protein